MGWNVWFQGSSNDWAPAAFFGSFSLAAGLLSAVLPETKGASLDEGEEEDKVTGVQNSSFQGDNTTRFWWRGLIRY